MQPGLNVKILPRKAQIEPQRLTVTVGVFIRQGIAKRCAVPAPDHGLAGVGDRSDRAQVIGVEIIQNFDRVYAR